MVNHMYDLIYPPISPLAKSTEAYNHFIPQDSAFVPSAFCHSQSGVLSEVHNLEITPRDHPGMIQVFLGHNGGHNVDGNELPHLMYVSREKRPSFQHHKWASAMNALICVSAVLTNAPFMLNLDYDHYINNSKAIRESMCFLMDPQINMKGLDGIQGSVYVGTSCVFRYQALYGYNPPKGLKRPKMVSCDCCPCFGRWKKPRFDNNDSELPVDGAFVTSTLMEQGGVPPSSSPAALLKEAIQVIRSGYEGKTEWGIEVIFGVVSSITEDILTSFKMHYRGWRSVYCIPERPAFKGSGPINLSDMLNQHICKPLLHCTLHLHFHHGDIEIRWSGVSIEEWWRNEQFWVIGGVSAHLFTVVQGLLKILVGIDTNFIVTSKASDDEEFGELYTFKWTTLLIPPTTILIINIIGVVVGISDAINSGYQSWGPLFGKLFFSLWVIVHLYPFLKGLMGRQNQTLTIVVIWSILLALIFSLLWVRIDPFMVRAIEPDDKQCGINC
ncbi:hypothetical protein IEQ34_008033 [Dendrobium chrysotoxum]|uniref:Cellulose synthase n=1 Tax=Dendrobium chrysotoxum TaxID=161865 RepID=A0AAV7H304_DENCH|nr:hypothetical protein IEQ34_008033 [Dendrobium chrysotoxum]